MKILFMRHANAYRANPRKWPNDQERPLRKKGIKRLKKISYALPVLGYSWDNLEVWTSPAYRCVQTADHLKQILNGNTNYIIVPELGENENPTLLLNKIITRNHPHTPLLLIGHGLNSQKFLSLILTRKKNKLRVSLKKASLAVIDFNTEKLQATLLGLYPPKALASLALLHECVQPD